MNLKKASFSNNSNNCFTRILFFHSLLNNNMRKVMYTIIFMLVAFTCLAIGLNSNQNGLIAEYFREMSTSGII